MSSEKVNEGVERSTLEPCKNTYLEFKEKEKDPTMLAERSKWVVPGKQGYDNVIRRKQLHRMI